MKSEKEAENLKEFVKERYSQIAREGSSCCSCSDTCGLGVIEQAKNIGYSEEELKSLPLSTNLGLGCGNPTALAELKEGETVLDLGSGSGIDVFLASKKVGTEGLVIGVDMTEDMVNKAREIAHQFGYQNVEFRLGEIENLPVQDSSIDVIISNCVVNLSPDKLRTYQEAFRVLKPGGRVLISDLVTEGEIPEDIKKSFAAWAGCIAGAMEKQEYLNTLKKAGFKDIAAVSEKIYYEPGIDDRLLGKIISVQIKAYK
ncbi:MAG: putative methyltransferase YcgJ [candidate division WS2 bacterium]|uniref:Arsenite methyltransferase n=1 Tax=Psychracetigena formicireducens TaxID=2986056 RepID=A0A9E2BKE1_PSYF1|nr:putative methyltransferase YcgJ [Candidatus Psychracetigena formicireducens]MBT9144699.1 putative methyltransferase YcgJ [Candidatus Psychracetigena formicireducens]